MQVKQEGALLLINKAMLHKYRRDSCRESSVVAGPHEQTDITYLQDHKLDCLQRGAKAPRVTDDLVRSRDELGCQTVSAVSTQ
jgi:hypothetical protein